MPYCTAIFIFNRTELILKYIPQPNIYADFLIFKNLRHREKETEEKGEGEAALRHGLSKTEARGQELNSVLLEFEFSSLSFRV